MQRSEVKSYFWLQRLFILEAILDLEGCDNFYLCYFWGIWGGDKMRVFEWTFCPCSYFYLRT
jgi:hypothetical protein